MTELTRVLNALSGGNANAYSELVVGIYQELHQMALSRLRGEKSVGALQATELVNEVYLRICANRPSQDMGSEASDAAQSDGPWVNRAHFFAAAAEAMRRILIEAARCRSALKRGGELHRMELDLQQFALTSSAEEMIAIDDLLEQLDAVDPPAAQMVKLRVFAGFKMADIAEILAVSPRTAQDIWSYAKAWLRERMKVNGNDL
jgi:RNA polymerase sigma factor (TIGR02999 family)